MVVTHRLRELHAEGKYKLADTLAVEVLRNETPSVTVKTDHVRVETATFVGEHPLPTSFDPTDEATVHEAFARTGTYRIRDDETGRTFTSGCLYDVVVDRLLETATDGPAAVNAVTTTADATTAAGSENDTPDDIEPTAPVETTRTPTGVLRQAVAAVQSQFRS